MGVKAYKIPHLNLRNQKNPPQINDGGPSFYELDL